MEGAGPGGLAEVATSAPANTSVRAPPRGIHEGIEPLTGWSGPMGSSEDGPELLALGAVVRHLRGTFASRMLGGAEVGA